MATSIALVTGHSRGLGEGIAAALLAKDFSVIGVSRNRSETLARQGGGRLRELDIDLADVDGVSHWLESPQFGELFAGAAIAVLVNNAGVLQPIGPLETQRVEDVARAANVNITAALMLSAAFVNATARAADRRILHVSSGAGRKAYAGWAIYCASKAALDHHARAVHADATRSLRIASLAPGIIDTRMQDEIRASTSERFPEHSRFVRLHREGALRDPMKVGRETVDFLLSKQFGDEPTAAL